MKIGILTFHRAINLGAVLQAYAMQETLLQSGYNATIIDYAPAYIHEAYAPIRSLSLRHPAGAMYELATAAARKRRIRKFNEFSDKYLKLQNVSFLNQCDYAVLGSDQIWNPSITGRRLDPIFFNQLPGNKALHGLAYAASTMSVSRLTEMDKKMMSEWLPGLKAVGVREKSLGDFLSKELGVDSSYVIDPTLLADKRIFDRFVSDDKNEKYLLFYEVWHNDEVESKARGIAKDLGLKFIGVSGSDIRFPRRNTRQIVSPDEFVNLVANASHVVTSSFHGTAFALIFEKQFNVVCEEPHQAVRMQELLNRIDCIDKFSYKLEPVNYREIDYTHVNQIIAEERSRSLSFLTENIQ